MEHRNGVVGNLEIKRSTRIRAGTNPALLHCWDEAVTRRSKRRLSRIAKGL
jgi:hypothetical protein